MRKTPKFSAASQLCRYIHPDYRKKKKRISPAAFRRTGRETYLSVNSTEVETPKQIAAYYSSLKENGKRPVAISAPRIKDYNDSVRPSGINIVFNRNKAIWEYHNTGGAKRAYGFYPNARSPSHSGANFIADLDDYGDFRFAVSIAGKRHFRLL